MKRRVRHEFAPYRPPAPTPVAALAPQPWRLHVDGHRAVLVSTATLVTLVSERKLIDIHRLEADRTLELAASMHAEGIHQPLRLAWDDRGRICMRDGHHRTATAHDYGVHELPVVLDHTELIRGAFSQPIGVVFAAVVASVERRDDRMRRAQEFALMALEDAGERGWSTGDAMCALKASLGHPLRADEADRMRRIDPALLLDDAPTSRANSRGCDQKDDAPEDASAQQDEYPEDGEDHGDDGQHGTVHISSVPT